MSLADFSIREYVSLLASDKPAPGGGSAAAFAGAAGAALAGMAGSFSAGRSAYAEHAEFNAELLERTAGMREEFLALADEDTVVFNAMSAAYKMPKNTAAEKSARSGAIQSALAGCIETPLKVMELCTAALEITGRAVGKTNPNVESDLGVAAVCLKAAARGAWLNVLVNLGGLKDAVFAGEARTKGEALLETTERAADRIYNSVVKTREK
jgi:formiminotetrahydrofolate cyclodeaminase